MGSRFYGHHDICENCGSSVRTLYSTFLWIPLSKVGRFRIIPTGGRSYIGRQVVARQIETVVRREPASALVSHPELDGDLAYKQAETHWDDSEPGQDGPVSLVVRSRRRSGRWRTPSATRPWRSARRIPTRRSTARR
jgi:hypothetical protein